MLLLYYKEQRETVKQVQYYSYPIVFLSKRIDDPRPKTDVKGVEIS